MTCGFYIVGQSGISNDMWVVLYDGSTNLSRLIPGAKHADNIIIGTPSHLEEILDLEPSRAHMFLVCMIYC